MLLTARNDQVSHTSKEVNYDRHMLRRTASAVHQKRSATSALAPVSFRVASDIVRGHRLAGYMFTRARALAHTEIR